jgi:ribosomal protein L37AE/L43A
MSIFLYSAKGELVYWGYDIEKLRQIIASLVGPDHKLHCKIKFETKEDAEDKLRYGCKSIIGGRQDCKGIEPEVWERTYIDGVKAQIPTVRAKMVLNKGEYVMKGLTPPSVPTCPECGRDMEHRIRYWYCKKDGHIIQGYKPGKTPTMNKEKVTEIKKDSMVEKSSIEPEDIILSSLYSNNSNILLDGIPINTFERRNPVKT